MRLLENGITVRRGCLGTRKFVDDFALIQNIRRVMERKGILVLYPEARYANVGNQLKAAPVCGKSW